MSVDTTGWDTSAVTTMRDMFFGCSKLTTVDVSNFDTSAVTFMRGMFQSCTALTSLDVSNFDTSAVTTMDMMFSGCSSLTSLDVSNFDTSEVTTMEQMFNGCSSLRYITLGAGFFGTSYAIPFNVCPNLGLNADGSDNGWLAHVAEVAPTLEEGTTKTIALHNNLKNKSWAATYRTQLQNKGYTIA